MRCGPRPRMRDRLRIHQNIRGAPRLSLNGTYTLIMNFAPPILPRQLVLPFADWHEPELATPWERRGIARSTYFNRRRLRRVAAKAFELGRRKRVVLQCVGSSTPVSRRQAAFDPSHAEAHELQALAARIARLSVSRTNPHAFFEDRSELAFELRAIAARRR
jgi:hypothetical protein